MVGAPYQTPAQLDPQALNAAIQALSQMQQQGSGGTADGGTNGAQMQQVSVQDVKALDFWGDLLGTALKVAPVLISLLEAEQAPQGGAQQQVSLQNVSAQDWQSIVGDVLKLIPQVISLFSVKVNEIGAQNVTALFDWGGLLKVALDAAPAIIKMFQAEQAPQGGAQQQVSLQSVSAQDWQDIVGTVLKLIPVAISLFQAQQAQISGQGVSGASTSGVGVQSSASSPQGANVTPSAIQ